MPIKGLDYAWWRPPSSRWLIDNGYEFVSRYLSWLPNGKVINKAEYDSLRSAGVKVTLNWEFDEDDYLSGYSGGVKNATEAIRQVRALGISEPFVVYFSVDRGSPNMNTVKDHFRGIVSVMGGAQYVGIYGGYDTVKTVMEAGLAKYGWQTYAWSSGRWYAPAQVRQVQNGIIGGNADLDYAQTTDYGYIGSETGEDMAITDEDAKKIATAVLQAAVTGSTLGDGSVQRTVEQVLADQEHSLDPYKPQWQNEALTKVREIHTAVKALAAPAPVDTDALATKIAAALVASNTNGLTTADHAAIVADIKSVFAKAGS